MANAETPASRAGQTDISLGMALLPILVLVALLAWNVWVFKDAALDGSNQFILLIGGGVAALVGFFHRVSFGEVMDSVAGNIRSAAGALLILLMVGALAGTWMISGIIPAMIYYGLDILNPTIFLFACLVICIVISLATGSSWTTSATVGIALIGIGNALGIAPGMTAGAVLSGAYFGDKMSPLSDTTNLAPVMAGTDLFTHIRYMALTTVPTIVVSALVFLVLGFFLKPEGQADIEGLQTAIKGSYHISGWLFLVPLAVIFMILKKAPPLVALLIGSLLGGLFALIFQPGLVAQAGGTETLDLMSGYKGILNAITVDVAADTGNGTLDELFGTSGMYGMLGTIWLIFCAMAFGGAMEAIGALQKITGALLALAKSTFGLFASTVGSCLALNLTASDQYLAIVVPGKMYSKAYRDRGLAPENLSRTLEDSGTVTSALVPWNTCGAYHSGVLGVGVAEYAVYAVFNYLSPFTTLLFAALNIKIRRLVSGDGKASA